MEFEGKIDVEKQVFYQQGNDSVIRRANWLERCWGQYQPSSACPQTNLWIKALQACLIWSLLCLTSYLLIGELATPPSGLLFQFLVLITVALVFGKLFDVIGLPPLIGMLIAGLLLKVLAWVQIEPYEKEVILPLRKISMSVILIKAGLYLKPEAMKRLSWVVARLALVPCCVEAITAMAAAYFILDMPLLWGILMGFVLGAVSPAILVPSLLKLQKNGYGSKSGIHTLGIAASTIDDIFAIFAFGIIFELIFKPDNLLQHLVKGPVEVLSGITFGTLYGLLLMYVPHKSDKNVVPVRVFLLLAGGIASIFGSQKAGFDGAGPLFCMVSAFVSSCGWSSKNEDPAVLKEVSRVFSGIWYLFEPILFSIIGAEMKFSHLTWPIVLQSLAVLGIALTMRFSAAYLVTMGGIFKNKERLFLATAWMPKASVQGLLGPMALEMAQMAKDKDAIDNGELVLTCAVLSIILTAPLGAIAIKVAGTHLLKRTSIEG